MKRRSKRRIRVTVGQVAALLGVLTSALTAVKLLVELIRLLNP
ncbi:hypothetical protein [Deinococcus sp. PEB2-63]